jgi:hypothetical protein
METLNQNEQLLSRETEGCNWVPEYGAWMVEGEHNLAHVVKYRNDVSAS